MDFLFTWMQGKCSGFWDTTEQRIESCDPLRESYAALLNYIEENSYEICGNIRESYIDGVWNKETEREWLTEIQVPVRRI